MREIVLDTETTGFDHAKDDRIVEIGCIELINHVPSGEHFQRYLNPERDMPPGAFAVHGLSAEFLANKPRFADVVDDFLGFVGKDPLIIHNAGFDLGFIDAELIRLGRPALARDTVVDTRSMARRKFPGAPASLDALCRRFAIDTSQRDLHGALLDAEILADVYLLLTGGQVTLALGDEEQTNNATTVQRIKKDRPPLRVIRADADELRRHNEKLDSLEQASDSGCLWKQLE